VALGQGADHHEDGPHQNQAQLDADLAGHLHHPQLGHPLDGLIQLGLTFCQGEGCLPRGLLVALDFGPAGLEEELD
jgi:hypothetical protein